MMVPHPQWGWGNINSSCLSSAPQSFMSSANTFHEGRFKQMIVYPGIRKIDDNINSNIHWAHLRHISLTCFSAVLDANLPTWFQFFKHLFPAKIIRWIPAILPCSLRRWDQRFFLQGHISFWGRRTVPSHTLDTIQDRNTCKLVFLRYQLRDGKPWCSFLPWRKCEW